VLIEGLMYITFRARQVESKLKQCFFKAGGLVLDAVARGPTEFCISGSRGVETVVFLYEDAYKLISVPFPDDARADALDADMRLLVAGTRSVLASDGTNVDVVSGTAACMISDLLEAGDSGKLVQLSYAGSSGYVATILVQCARIHGVGAELKRIVFHRESGNSNLNAASRKLLQDATDKTWETRSNDIVYSRAPSLTKLDIQTAPNSGVGNGGSTFPGTFVNGALPFDISTVDALLGHSIDAVLSRLSASERRSFYSETRAPGVAAAKHATKVGTAVSVFSSFVMVYRSDKSCASTSQGLKSTLFENWQQCCTRSALFAGDCEDGTKLSSDIIYAVRSMDAGDISKHRHLKLIRNTMVPYYMGPCTSVIGASAGSAARKPRGGIDENINGHAAGLLLESMEYIAAVSKGDEIRKQPQAEGSARLAYRECVFQSIFNDDAKRGLPDREVAWMSSYEVAKKHMPKFPPLVIETTTPADCMLAGNTSGAVPERVANGHGVIDRLGLAIPRTLSNLSKSNFYQEFVELIFPYDFHPPWKDPAVRRRWKVSNHFAVVSPTNSRACGVGPKGLHSSEFALIPLYEHCASDAGIIEAAVAKAAKHVAGPRISVEAHDSRQASNVLRSVEALKSIDNQTQTVLKMGYGTLRDYLVSTTNKTAKCNKAPHAIHTVPFNAILENPTFLETVCLKIKKSGARVAVEVCHVPGLGGTTDGVVATIFEFESDL